MRKSLHRETSNKNNQSNQEILRISHTLQNYGYLKCMELPLWSVSLKQKSERCFFLEN